MKGTLSTLFLDVAILNLLFYIFWFFCYDGNRSKSTIASFFSLICPSLSYVDASCYLSLVI